MLRNVKADYLKYVRVVRTYMAMLYGIDNNQVEMLLYLYSFQYFTWDDIALFQKTIFFAKDAFEELLERKFIIIHAEFKKKGKKRKVKCISYKLGASGNNLCRKMYEFIEKERLLSISPQSNVLLRYKKNSRVIATKAVMAVLNAEILQKKADEAYEMNDIDLDF